MNDLNKKIAITASFLGAITISIGAFGAHGLKNIVDIAAQASFETGVRYQMYHVLALLLLSSLEVSEKTKQWVFRFFIMGMILFSVSIYLLAIKQYLPFSSTFLGPITPVGGLLFMIGWIRLAYGYYKSQER